jgi:hypothetical protein
MAITLDEALAYGEERDFDLVEVEPNDFSADRRTMLLVIGDGQQVLVTVGWGAAGFYADVCLYADGEPVQPIVMEADGVVSILTP